MKLGYNEIMITSMYFNDINDFINLELGVKRFRGNIERFHFNPIPLNEYSRRLFANIETFHIYNKKDKIFNDGKIFKKVIWYTVDYSEYLQEKEQGNICKNIEYTKEDRNTYGNTIPSEVKSLGYKCFDECYSLTSINIPSSISFIGDDCFSGCSSLTSINIDNLQYISKERIFMNEPVLVSIEIPKNIQIINGKNIKKKDINEFIIPSSITKLGEYCFSGCSTLTSITIPSSISEIGDSCFDECITLKSINVPSSISEIGNWCFYECTSLTSIIIPTSISELGYDCFKGCYSLTSINLPSSINEIGYECFKYCSSLTSINIPSSIISFGGGCFYGCGCEEELMKNETKARDCFDEW
ncbi:hypothetical protein EDI_014330 [Entamoeba dispar SAW760]|uniref:Leucine rich repeat containing protein BspA family protein n=1 Tax=Entamoeba dispar (strain ATCC PRA-260 / SAW760) TaxID=370354 RepID=B0E7P9_ENTDS|nr:uncharacterized protein EDI_014330 [Entamoeba dispar SAW760]EDR29443.1 hypothetical protein EDI_014330 [Entamoeba dispar SAW760]|eukprot:EDR29443.1 hypothetical protein EDI_014330 [Entamoeba dispar SAW760]